MLGYRRLRGVDYYGDDQTGYRQMGLFRQPDFTDISRALSQMENQGDVKVQQFSGAWNHEVISFFQYNVLKVLNP